MAAGIFGSVEWLRSENNRGYGTLSIPQPLDDKISGLLRSWLSLEWTVRMASLVQISEDYRFTLIGYSERMASLAVRDRNRELILLGLLAIGLDGWRDDWRDSASVVCLHYDASHRIGACAREIFQEAATSLPERPARALRSFLLRSEEDKAVGAMGYVATNDADGFRYKRAW